jgi:hypothetical protein
VGGDGDREQREEAAGGSSGRGAGSGQKLDDVTETESDWLVSIGSFCYWPTSQLGKSCNLQVSLAKQLWNCITVCFLDSTRQN